MLKVLIRKLLRAEQKPRARGDPYNAWRLLSARQLLPRESHADVNNI